MNDKVGINIFQIGIETAHVLTHQDDDNFVYERACKFLFNSLKQYVEYIAIYVIDEKGEYLQEEVIGDALSIRQGNDIIPLYQLLDEFGKGNNYTQICSEKEYYIKLPLNNRNNLFGLLELRSKDPLSENMLNEFSYLSTAIALGVQQIILSRKNNLNRKILKMTVDVSKHLQSLISTKELTATFARCILEHLNLDRVTIFLYDDDEKDVIFNYCLDFNGKVYHLTKIPTIPKLDRTPKPLDQVVGYWFPLITNTRTVGVALFDNIYSSYVIPEWFCDILSPLCSQFASAVDNVRLFNNVQKSAQTDKLTGLYNRAYFEDNISKLCSKANMPLSLIIGDVNGLKITNDVFGHYEGDKLLLSIGNILHNVCGENNLIARWGGDEFIVVLPNTTEKNVELICNQINEECIKNSTLKLKISISMGHATMISTDENILHIIRNAEDRMYRNKLLDRNSFRSSFISSLKETLHENCQETEEHLDRMHKLAEKTGKILNLSENEISDLKLLALLHDVGKVAISDYIVNKPGELTREEWETMKNHTEIGYRIVQSSPDLAQIAHYILYHHERWDGKGYPSGKKGDEIPKLSRIISIIDAYDVMTHERKYKKPISHNKAIAELIRCSGTQFDPNLVAVFCNAFKKSD